MPLITAAYLAVAAGLLTGFGGAAVPGAAAALVGAALAAAALAALRRRGSLAALALLAASGAVQGAATLRRDRACAERLAHADAWTVRLLDPAAPGAHARGAVAERGCLVSVSLAVRQGAAPAGATVRVAGGPAVRTTKGLAVKRASLQVVTPPGGAARLRAHAAAAIDAVFRGDSALARALLIADARSLTPELRERHAAAGTIHMLSISGLHVALIASAAGLLLSALRVPRRAGEAGAVALTAAYVLVIGAPAPALRAGVMLGVGAAARLLQRPTSPWAALSLGAAAPLVDPRTVLDLGYQLSVAGMAALTAGGALTRRALAARLDGWRLTLARELTASVLASLVTAPLVAWTFGRVSLVAPLTNLVAAPLLALAQPMLFLALLAAPAPPLARFVADAAHPLLIAFDLLAAAAAAVPYAAVGVAPTLLGAAAAGGAAAALVVACASQFPARALLAGAAALCVATWAPSVPRQSGLLELQMIDVGQGDAIALRTPRGRWLLFDAGRSWRGGDAGRATVTPYLRRRGGELVGFVLSHPHADHVGGAASVLRALRPRAYWDAAFAGTGDAYRASLLAAADLGVPWRRVRPGASFDLDGVHVRFLAPDSAWTVSLADPNEASTVAAVRYGAVRFLLVGDAERAEEEWLLNHAADELRADVLKVGHHGSRTSTGAGFLAAVRPSVALVPVGAGNGYGHPSPEVVLALLDAGAAVLRSDVLGSVVVRTDGRRITVEASGETWEPGAASSPR